MIAKLWTVFEDDRLNAIVHAARSDGRPIMTAEWVKIAAQFPSRTPRAVRQRASVLTERRHRAEKDAAGNVGPKRVALAGPATITAAVFGDPLPGRSALDQRRRASCERAAQ